MPVVTCPRCESRYDPGMDDELEDIDPRQMSLKVVCPVCGQWLRLPEREPVEGPAVPPDMLEAMKGQSRLIERGLANRVSGSARPPIAWTCACGQALSAADELAGQEAACPECGLVSTVPLPVARPAPPPARPVAAPSSRRSRREEDEDRPRRRSRDDDEYDDDRPRRRSREEDEDRPRRRRREPQPQPTIAPVQRVGYVIGGAALALLGCAFLFFLCAVTDKSFPILFLIIAAAMIVGGLTGMVMGFTGRRPEDDEDKD